MEEEQEFIEPIDNEVKSDKIETTSATKQTLSYLFARHLSTQKGMPDNFMHLRLFLVSALGDYRLKDNMINNLKKAGFVPEEVIKAIDMYRAEYSQIAIMQRLVLELSSKYKENESPNQIIDEVKNMIKKMNTDLPIINDYLYICFIALILGTDLENVSAPREQIISPDMFTLEGSKLITKPSMRL